MTSSSPVFSPDDYQQASEAAEFIRKQIHVQPRIVLVLGSGLGAFADELDDACIIPYSEIPHFPRSSAIGHAGKLVIGRVGETPAAVMAGRVHYYEGYSMQRVTFPMRVFSRLGIQT